MVNGCTPWDLMWKCLLNPGTYFEVWRFYQLYCIIKPLTELIEVEWYICIGNLTIIGSVNGLSPGQHQAIIWTNVEIFLTGPLGTNFREILIAIHTFSFKKMHLEMLSVKCRPFCLSLNVLILFGYFSVYWWQRVTWQPLRTMVNNVYPWEDGCPHLNIKSIPATWQTCIQNYVQKLLSWEYQSW